jgi:hypothetical protein
VVMARKLASQVRGLSEAQFREAWTCLLGVEGWDQNVMRL